MSGSLDLKKIYFSCGSCVNLKLIPPKEYVSALKIII